MGFLIPDIFTTIFKPTKKMPHYGRHFSTGFFYLCNGEVLRPSFVFSCKKKILPEQKIGGGKKLLNKNYFLSKKYFLAIGMF